MLFDDLDATKKELTGHIDAACNALAFLREVDPPNALRGKPDYDQWVFHMNALNSARVWLSMAADHLHTDLNNFNDEVIQADSEKQI